MGSGTMVAHGKMLAAAVVGALALRQSAFVPPPASSMRPVLPISAAAGAVAALGCAPAFADEIGDAAAKLSKAAYPFMKEVPWNSNLYNLNPARHSTFVPPPASPELLGAALSPTTCTHR